MSKSRQPRAVVLHNGAYRHVGDLRNRHTDQLGGSALAARTRSCLQANAMHGAEIRHKFSRSSTLEVSATPLATHVAPQVGPTGVACSGQGFLWFGAVSPPFLSTWRKMRQPRTISYIRSCSQNWALLVTGRSSAATHARLRPPQCNP
jgi:hypothetical protein